MAKVCQITGRKRMIGYNVAHSKLRTKRDFALNLKTKKFWSEAEQRFVTLKVSCKGMRTIEKNGLDATLKAAQKRDLLALFKNHLSYGKESKRKQGAGHPRMH
jgi:ribosomal protein L28